MRVALVNPGSPRALLKENLALASLAAVLTERGHEVTIADELAGQDVDARVNAFRPDLVGIGAMTMFAPRAYAIADGLRARGVPVVLGGAHPTALPEEALEHADAVVRGEAEVTFPRLIESKAVSGIVEPEPPQDLDALPLPRRDLLELDIYARSADVIAGHSFRSLGVITSRGCPFHCTFCVNSKREVCLRFHGPERVVAELEELVGRYAIQSVAFYDELIASDTARFRRLCQLMIDRGLNRLRWECQMHPTSVTPKLLHLMKEAGCLQVAMGFESGSQRVLDAIGKRTTVERNLEAAHRAREAGLKVRGCFVLGMPGETAEDIQRTERFIDEAPIDFAGVHFLTPMPGTALFDRYADRIRAANAGWDTFTAGDPQTFVCNDAMPAEEQRRAFLRLSARLAFRNYTWGEKLRRAMREPRRAVHVLLQRLR